LLVESAPFEQQLSLFDETEPLHRAVDAVRDRYGYDAVHLAAAEARDEE